MNHKDETKAVNILFTCTQNAVRSVIAKGLLQQKHTSNIGQIASCGVIAGVPDGFAMAVMSEIDIDITDHEPVAFDSFSAADFQFVISFSHDAEHVVTQWASPDTTTLFWEVQAPVLSESSREDTLASYRALRDDIAGRLDSFISEHLT
ncbi:MAG: low molecular weight phosphatase family protein [Candidatus Puniceispirillaceae bacterium]